MHKHTFKLMFAAAVLTLSACGSDSSSSSGGSASESGSILAHDESRKIINFVLDEGYCEYDNSHLTWVAADNEGEAYKYKVKNDTLLMYPYDIEEKETSDYAIVLVGGGNSIFNEWTQTPCFEYDGDIECERENSAFISSIKFSDSKVTAYYGIDPDFNFQSSYMLEDIVRAILDKKGEVHPGEWVYSKSYSKSFWEDIADDYDLDKRISFDGIDNNNLDIKLEGVVFEVRKIKIKYDNDGSSISAKVSTEEGTCELDYNYFNVTEDNCLDKNILKLDVSDDRAYGYIESNHEDFAECLHDLYRNSI
ncbi:MAG: hypothetical protein MJY47_04145 [Fibrobacter sp.]|nr:hypothetical protein [Fibrobacter sp.]